MGLAERLWNKENQPAHQSLFVDDIKQVIADLIKVNPKCIIILFGSVAKNTADHYSDLDIAVYLEDSGNLSEFKKSFYKLRTRIKRPVDILFKKKSELNKLGDTPINEQIQKDGIELYPDWKFNG
jgi:predicted nucleotidyltransferase